MALEDIDELSGDTIPCSPSAFHRERDVTQATQIPSRPTLTPFGSSSPASVVEVPASSPFQQPPQLAKLGSRLAPAGTLFRPPPRQNNLPVSKRRTPEPISLLSDDDESLTPPRGNIRPTTFKAQMANYAYRPPMDEKETNKKMRQIFDVFGDRFPAHKVKEALREGKNDIDDAIIWLEEHGSSQSQKLQPAAKPNGRRLVSKGTLQASSKPIRVTISSSPPAPAATPPKPHGRRLMQGLRKRSAPSPEPSELPPPPSSDDPLIIDLVDNDKEDAYRAEPSPSPTQDDDNKVLNSINTSTLKELAAMTGMKESLLEPMVEARPFTSLQQARRVSVSKKPGSRKSARLSIGETVVDAVEVFLNAVEAIDQVVAKCEMKAQAVKAVVDNWDLDNFGHIKTSTRTTPEGDMPPTPTSMSGSKYTRPLVPCQPKLMDGHCKMKPFQLFGLNWMSVLYNYDIGCILADEMGLGKTCQVISLMCHLVEEDEKQRKGRRPWPNLIVVPPSTYNNWLAEFEKFAPGLSVMGYRGSQSERAEIAYEVKHDPDSYHVVLATYSQINSEEDVEAMQSFDLNAAIFDEGHKMKNPGTKIYRDLQRITAQWKLLLTGLSPLISP